MPKTRRVVIEHLAESEDTNDFVSHHGGAQLQSESFDVL